MSPQRRDNLALVIVVILGVFAVWFVSEAWSHGPHHSPIKPAYDCFYNPDGWDTRGDVVITRDDDMDVWVVWRCECEWLDWIKERRCWWHDKGRYYKKERAVERARELTGSRHGPEVLRRIPVSWMAKHGDDGCFRHTGYRWAVVIRKAG